MKVKVQIKRIDRGRKRIQNLLRSVRDDASFVKVGLLGSKKATRASSDKLTNAQVAIINEFGSSRTPARPFIMPAFRRHRAEYMVILSDLVKRLVRTGDRSYTDVLSMLGAKAAADFKNFVTQGSEIPPPNAQSTLDRKMRRDQANWEAKGRRAAKNPGKVREGPVMAPRTLVDTGRMVGAITWLVVPKSSLGISNTFSRAQRAFVPPKKPRTSRRKKS